MKINILIAAGSSAHQRMGITEQLGAIYIRCTKRGLYPRFDGQDIVCTVMEVESYDSLERVEPALLALLWDGKILCFTFPDMVPPNFCDCDAHRAGFPEYCTHIGELNHYSPAKGTPDTGIFPKAPNLGVRSTSLVTGWPERGVVYQDEDFRVVYDSDLDVYYPQYLEKSLLSPGKKAWRSYYDGRGQRCFEIFYTRAVEWKEREYSYGDR